MAAGFSSEMSQYFSAILKTIRDNVLILINIYIGDVMPNAYTLDVGSMT